MNIFALAANATLAASLHCDVHVIKMLLESTQILYAALHLRGIPVIGEGYAVTHKNHPCVLWAAGCRAHFRWLLDLAQALCAEYTMRAFERQRTYKTHACEPHLARIRLAMAAVDPVDFPEQITAANWLGWIADTLNLSHQACIEMVGRVATCNPPEGCLFGVLCVEPNPTWGPKLAPEAHAEAKRALTRRCAVTSDIDLIASYRLYYAKKAKSDFAFTWTGAAAPPPPLRSAWAEHRPDCPPITLAEQRAAESARRAEKKRKAADELAAAAS